MVKRGLGSSGIEVGPIAFGCNVFGWTADEAMSFRLLDAFTAAGSNLIDTADSYSKRVIGASNYSAERLSQEMEICEQRGLPCYRTLQTLYNLYDRADYEAHLQPLCLKRGLGVLTYFSPASGFLSGKCRSENDLAEKAREEMVRKYLADRGLRILDALERVAKQHRATPAAVSLAWLMFASRHNRAYRKCHESQTAQGIA